jgi:hypothetical protein
VFGRLAVNDGLRHAADRLWPDRCCGSVAIIARPRDATRQLLAKPVELSFDQIVHFLLLPLGPAHRTRAFGVRGARLKRWGAEDLGTISGKMNRITIETVIRLRDYGPWIIHPRLWPHDFRA